MRSISWLFRAFGFASELEAERPATLPHRDCARPEGLRIPVSLAAGPLQQGGTAGTKRLICGAYRGFSAPSALQASLKPEDPPRSLIGIVLAREGCAFPYRSPRGPCNKEERLGQNG
ncbi:hypothetical protein B5F81_05755 [Muribaculum sp. An287]|nr:hypothetical protein B5F81_05755 [Muribaculum sp. An287]